MTKPLDADPDHLTEFPRPSPWPFLASLATTALFIGSVFTPWGITWGLIPLAITLTAWFWPTRREAARRREEERWQTE